MRANSRSSGGKIVQGALSGFAATAPMTAAMVLMYRLLPPHQRHALPPRHVTENAAKTIGMNRHLSERQRQVATLAAHFGYGTAMGTIYEMIAPKMKAPRIASGIGWGLFVWAASYLGLLPAARLHEPATQHPAERNALMILAHVVWGGTLGWLSSKSQAASRLRVDRAQELASAKR